MNLRSERDWLEDFKEFIETPDTVVPPEVSQKILSRIHVALNPSAWLIFAKLLGIHSVVGTFSLAVCDQFGMSPFNTGISLSEFFMEFGHSFCMGLCGFLFLGLSVLIASLVFRPEEFNVLRKNSFIQIFVLSILSLAAFFFMGAELLVGIGLIWLIGAFLGGLTPILALKRNPIV